MEIDSGSLQSSQHEKTLADDVAGKSAQMLPLVKAGFHLSLNIVANSHTVSAINGSKLLKVLYFIHYLHLVAPSSRVFFGKLRRRR